MAIDQDDAANLAPSDIGTAPVSDETSPIDEDATPSASVVAAPEVVEPEGGDQVEPEREPAHEPARGSILTDQERAELQRAAVAAIENNAVATLTDAANREWFVGIDIVDNRSTVLIQARRGMFAVGQHLPTATINPDVVSAAIAEIDATVAS